MITCYDVVKALVRTEKGTALEPQGQYLFRVATNATKIDVKRAVEEIYKVKVDSVNTTHVPGKLKRVRYKAGYTAGWKKAIVSLKEGQKIEGV
ncbi:MAG: 50S ribosomal protein L23 [Candidatus Omnitrophica bacterium]|nr:50S ribosomal protein L23 [Candidatus Omnitrophota bacterium]MDE2008521.1 50S ribosomal protein L23 [Candidatus Omnitrophota bacterium]MDE2213987.1 50S ribosomal protein L23 [Candidatus Omnitrophota bacterium]MDE2231358.1 50S ribosomal protein L23 [Candidatus Omnitrophota bacterium]